MKPSIAGTPDPIPEKRKDRPRKKGDVHVQESPKKDRVDEAGEESFPASDPPSFNPSKVG